MSETIYYKTITISTGSFVQIEMAIRLEIAIMLERRVDRAHQDASFRRIDVKRLAELRAALVEFTA